MFKMNLTDKTKGKKVLTVLGWIVIGTLAFALVFGIVDATSKNGEGLFGITSYRYEEEGYSIGSSTIRSDQITSIELDWIAGEVEVVLCQDAFPSVTETYEGTVAENENMRWKLSEDGTTFSVKCRKSSAFLGFGVKKEKKLTLRIPEKLVGQIETLSVNARGADVTLDGVSVDTLSMTSVSGNLTISGGAYHTVAASTTSGDIALFLPETSGFSLTYGGDWDRFVCNRTLTPKGDTRVYGDGETQLILADEKGSVKIQLDKEG